MKSATCLWPTALIAWGPGSAVPHHAHHCAQLIVALDGLLRVRRQLTAAWHECSAAVVRGDIDHEIDSTGSFVVSAFVGAGKAVGPALTKSSEIGIVASVDAARWRRALGDISTLDGARVKWWFTSTFVRSMPDPRVHPAVDRVLSILHHDPFETAKTSLLSLSKMAGLSTSRFAHVFSQSTGVPVRPYIRWLRLQCAVRELAMGRSATEAALIAGFSDAAHLTRTVRRTLGGSPRDLIASRA